MKKTNVLLKLQRRRRLPAIVLALALALVMTVFVDGFSIVSHAESAGRVKSASGANVRSSANASATVLTSLAQDATVSIRSQTQGSDGNIWYEVSVTNGVGYIRSDLIEITDGSTPPTSTEVASSGGTDNAGTGTSGDTGASVDTSNVTAVNPVSATVSGGGSGGVRVRADASAAKNNNILTTVQNGLALTVTGQASSLDNDGKTWYQVNFVSNDTEVTGFIREDYVTLAGELTPYVEPEAEPEVADDTAPVSPSEATKDYDTVYQDGQWYLVVTATNQGYLIDDMFNQATQYKQMYDESEKQVKTEKIWIIVLVILLVVAVGAVAFLIFKVKDMMDSAYFSEVENETLRRRGAQEDKKVMQNVGADKRSASQGQRPAGARPGGPGPRPTGNSQGQRPAGSSQGQRPAGAGQGQRPAGAGQSQRPVGSSQGQRPAGAGQSQRPAGSSQGQRPAGAGQSQRPAGSSQGQRPAGNTQNQRPATAAQSQASPKPQSKSGSGQGWQSKNFMANEDDEFEFEFLNYEGDEEQ